MMAPLTLNAIAVAVCLGVLVSACSGDATAAGSSTAGGGGSSHSGASAGGANAAGGAEAAGGARGADAAGAAGHAAASAGTGGALSGSGGGSGGGNVKTASCKRGVAYGHHSIADLQALSAGVSWWYNWDFRPDQDLRGGAYLEAGVEYVPMIWGAASDRAAAKMAIGDDATALLGFNEPNFGAQANLSAKAAAALWPELSAIADAKGLRLVSPAVNFCGGDCQDTDPFHYLDAFFAACSGCRVDAIAMHIYVGCSPSGDNKAEYLIQHVETYKSRFSQPLWLTEFACDSAKDSAEQQAFLEDAVAYLEAEPRIERYAWFSGRASNVANVDLLADSGQLTALGKAYVNAPRNSECGR
ncbi:MAG: glycoside hydrolase family protein [Pseudomonadota bacterium]